MNRLDKNLIVQIGLELNTSDVLSLCLTNKRFHTIWKSNNFWYRKIIRDYDFRPNDIKNSKICYQIIKKNWNNWDGGLFKAAKIGYKDLLDFFIQKGANNWNWGMCGAAKGGYKDLVNFFIQKGANYWNHGMCVAARNGRKDLVNFFIQKGANNWTMGAGEATRGGHKDLIDFFKQQYEESIRWL